MEWKVKTWYKVYSTILSSVSTFLVLYIFSFQISRIVALIASLCYLLVLLVTLETFVLRVKIDGKALRFLFYKVNLDDIIEVRCKLFSTVIRTRWKVYRLPPMQSCTLLNKDNYFGK